MDNTLGEWLEARRPPDLKYSAIARHLRVDRALAWRWFQVDPNKARTPSIEQLERLCDLFKVPIAERGGALSLHGSKAA